MLYVAHEEQMTAYRVAQPEPMQLKPTLEAQASWDSDSGQFAIDHGPEQVAAQRLDWADLDERPVMEFSLDALPDDAYITSASITLDVAFHTKDPGAGEDGLGILSLYGYAGDGEITPDDPLTLDLLLGHSDPIDENIEIEIELDAEVLRQILEGPNPSHLGIVGVGDEDGHQLGWHTWNSLSGDGPTLALEWDWVQMVPEAGTFAIVVFGMAMVALRRPRRSGQRL